MYGGKRMRREFRIGKQAGELCERSAALPQVGGREVCIELRAISLNYRDLLYIDSEPASVGLVPGSDAAGVIVELGQEITGFRIGDRVMPAFFTTWIEGRYDVKYRQSALGGARAGAFATHIVVPASSLVRIPPSVSLREAACLPCAAVTAWNALVGRSQVKAGDRVLVQGTGGVSLFAVQIALALGAEPIVLSGSREKITRVQQLGVKHCINYREQPNWEDIVYDRTSGRGCDHIVELIGNTNLSRTTRCLRPGGVISYIGCLGGYDGGFNPLDLLYKNATLQAIYVGSRTDLEQTTEDIQRWGIKPIIDRQRFAFDEIPQAVDFVRRGRHFGKVVVEIGVGEET